jgi:hypothetical protein
MAMPRANLEDVQESSSPNWILLLSRRPIRVGPTADTAELGTGGWLDGFGGVDQLAVAWPL